MTTCQRCSQPNSQLRRSHFFKVILHSSIQDGRLDIPVGFVQKFGEELSDSAVLKVPNGEEWVVKLKENDGAISFRSGLKEFFKHYKISPGYFLLFRYDGDSSFHVIVLKHDSCELKYTIQESNLRDQHLTLENEGTPVSNPDCLAQKKRKRKEIVGKRTKPSAAEEEVIKESDNQQAAQRSGIPPSLLCLDSEYDWSDLRKQRPVTKEERNRAINAARSLKTQNPSFMVIMKPSYLRKGLNVPLVFAREHFIDGAHSVILRLPNGRAWTVNFFLSGSIKALLSGGWKAFARENVLLDGDCCVFELLKEKDIEMKVSIFRVVDDWVPLVGSETADMRKQRIFKENKATQAAREFKSEYPFYTAYIRRSYAQKGFMIIKADFIRVHLSEEVDMVTLQDSDGRKWPVKCIIEGNQGKLISGWSKFTKAHNIEQGDVCAFELIKKKGTVLKVTIFKSH